jgi:4'-phosphopantetheinyl transferase
MTAAAGTVAVHWVPLVEGIGEASLSPRERARAARFLVAGARTTWIRSRAALRSVLGAALGVAPGALQIEQDELGAPRLEGYPGLCFSLSRSGAAALIAWTMGRRIGVDLEEVSGADRLPPPGDLLSPAELARHRELPLQARPEALLQQLVRKEAALKAMGTGFSIPPTAVEVTAEGGGWTRIDAGLLVTDLDLGSRHRAALAITSPPDMDGTPGFTICQGVPSLRRTGGG